MLCGNEERLREECGLQKRLAKGIPGDLHLLTLFEDQKALGIVLHKL